MSYYFHEGLVILVTVCFVIISLVFAICYTTNLQAEVWKVCLEKNTVAECERSLK